MSEIKGQLLGIILVLSIFATVSAALATVYGKMTTSISSQVSSITATDLQTSNTVNDVTVMNY